MGRRLTQEEFVAKVKEVHGGKFTVKGTYGGRHKRRERGAAA
jgi:hypothetical protein